MTASLFEMRNGPFNVATPRYTGRRYCRERWNTSNVYFRRGFLPLYIHPDLSYFYFLEGTGVVLRGICGSGRILRGLGFYTRPLSVTSFHSVVFFTDTSKTVVFTLVFLSSPFEETLTSRVRKSLLRTTNKEGTILIKL